MLSLSFNEAVHCPSGSAGTLEYLDCKLFLYLCRKLPGAKQTMLIFSPCRQFGTGTNIHDSRLKTKCFIPTRLQCVLYLVFDGFAFLAPGFVSDSSSLVRTRQRFHPLEKLVCCHFSSFAERLPAEGWLMVGIVHSR